MLRLGMRAGQRVARILDAAGEAGAQHGRRISTATLNMVVREATNWRAPPTLRGASKKGRIYYATQARAACALLGLHARA
jgi:GTP-binding protein